MTTDKTTEQPPLTNRGVELHPDYLAITCWGTPSQAFPIVYRTLWGMEPERWDDPLYKHTHGARGYDGFWSGPDGSKFYGFPSNESNTYCSFELSGKPLAEIVDLHGKLASMKLAFGQENIKIRASRFDLAWDYCPFSPLEAREAWKAGKVKTRIPLHSYRWMESPEGNTFYAGSPKSQKRLRVYDRRGYTRLEMQARKDNSDSLFLDYLYFPENLTGWLCGVVTWEMPWFEQFMQGPIRLKVEGDTDATKLRNFRAYIGRLLPSLLIAKELFGGCLLYTSDAADE